VDIIIYGHSHEAKKQLIRGSLLFNPGRARDSFGIIEIGAELKAYAKSFERSNYVKDKRNKNR